MRPKRIIVTGGRGRLAALLAAHLRAPAYEVALFSRTASPGFQELDGLTRSETYLGGDTVLHLAWSTLPATSETPPRSEWQHDLPLLENMLGALTTLNTTERPHFVFLSSGGTVYGNAPGRPSCEADPCRPLGWYGQAKLAAEEMIEAAAARHGLGCTILRLSNPYGYSVGKTRAQGLIPHALRCAMEGHALTLFGDGSARKDFLHCSDFLAAMDRVIALRPAGIFNLGAGESHSVREVLALVEQHTGRAVPLHHAPAPAWDVQDCRLDITRFCAATGWRPLVTLDEGIRLSVRDYIAS